MREIGHPIEHPLMCGCGKSRMSKRRENLGGEVPKDIGTVVSRAGSGYHVLFVAPTETLKKQYVFPSRLGRIHRAGAECDRGV